MAKLDITLGQQIAFCRRHVGKSQESLADECKLHRTYISQLERGLKSPTVRVLFAIAKCLEIRPSDLLKRVEADV